MPKELLAAEPQENDTEAAVADPRALLAGVQKELIGAHFLLLARLLRRSARADYASFEPQNLVERRLVLALYRLEAGRVSELATMLGNDVAQVSRALAGLRTQRLARRERQRDPYVLTPAGVRLGELLDNVASLREREFGHGLEPHEMFELAGLLSHLQSRAMATLADETALSREGTSPEMMAAVPEIHSRLQPAVLNLATIIARTSTLSFKRLAGLSQYEWRLLANIAARPGVSFMEVVGLVDSDKAQVSRALDAMVGNGVLDRTGGQGRQAVRFTVTGEGHRLHDIMRDDARRRNANILEDLKPGQRRRLHGYVERLIENAAAMAERAV